MAEIDEVTRRWIRNKSDELAAANGCWFNPERGAYAVWWIEYYCRLYEGEYAKQNFLCRSGMEHLLETHPRDFPEWSKGGEDYSLARCSAYMEWLDGGGQPDWQYECTMRLFGWERRSEQYDRDIRRFNRACVFVSKKNKKTPTLAAWSLFLTCGDGEEGAKTFGGAKDGKQALIAMDHAIAMVEQSPELSKVCKINKNEHSILHMPTRSKYAPLSSANERTWESKEGLNGNLAIDETHVVDHAFMRRIRRAGISRVEPLHIEVSTAGNNPNGYGKQTYDLAKRVLTGQSLNDQMFVAIYEAPQDLTGADLSADPVKYAKMANPAWGHTVHEEEFRNDYQQSLATNMDLADFMLYRLNIWQQSASPWIRESDFTKCYEAFGLSV